MSLKDRIKRIEKAHKPVNNELQAFLPSYLQDDSYVEPEITGRVIVPRGYMALQPDGTVKFKV